MSLQYRQSSVLVWEIVGTGHFKGYFGQGEPIYLLSISGKTSLNIAHNVLVDLESPHGSSLDSTMMTIKNVSSTDPIKVRLLDEAEQYVIGTLERLHIHVQDGEPELTNWNLTVKAVPVRLTSNGQAGFVEGIPNA